MIEAMKKRMPVHIFFTGPKLFECFNHRWSQYMSGAGLKIHTKVEMPNKITILRNQAWTTMHFMTAAKIDNVIKWYKTLKKLKEKGIRVILLMPLPVIFKKQAYNFLAFFTF